MNLQLLNRAFLVAPLCLVFTRFAAAQTPPPNLQERVEALLRAPAFKPATVGILIRSLRDGRVLYEKNADTVLMPASNNKILTASTALLRLGVDYRFHTVLYRTGTIGQDGTLNGDVFLKGAGDPSFSSADLLILAQALRAQGVTRVTGRFVADATRFSDGPLGSGWPWDDDPYDYQPQISALSCDENVIGITALPGSAEGMPATIRLGVPTDYVSVRGSVLTVAPADATKPESHVSFDRPRARNVFDVSGTIAIGAGPAKDALTIEDPDLYAVTRLAESLAQVGIAVPESWARRIGRGTTPQDAVPVGEKISEPLATLTRHFLKTSDNLYGELFLRTVGSEKGRSGTANGGALVVRGLLADANVDTNGWRMADGSGLSREDLVSARQIAGVLAYIDSKFPADARKAFEDALPVGGVDGTLRNRFKNTSATGAVHAKTGSLNRVSSLSGYVTTQGGEPLVFSLLMNNYAGTAAVAHAAQDAIVIALRTLPTDAAR